MFGRTSQQHLSGEFSRRIFVAQIVFIAVMQAESGIHYAAAGLFRNKRQLDAGLELAAYGSLIDIDWTGIESFPGRKGGIAFVIIDQRRDRGRFRNGCA